MLCLQDDTDIVVYHLTKSVPHLSVDIDWLRAVPSFLDIDAPQPSSVQPCHDEAGGIAAGEAVGDATEPANGPQNPNPANAAVRNVKQVRI